MKRFRIIDTQPARRFSSLLEDRAQALAESPQSGWEDSNIRSLSREISLVLDHLKGVRDREQGLLRRLRNFEIEVDAELSMLAPHGHIYSHRQFVRREQLREKLWRIEAEKRQIALGTLDRIQPLHDRLLLLLNRHARLSMDHGH